MDIHTEGGFQGHNFFVFDFELTFQCSRMYSRFAIWSLFTLGNEVKNKPFSKTLTTIGATNSFSMKVRFNKEQMERLEG